MRKVLTLVIISVFILIVVNLKNFKDIIVFHEVKIKLSKLSLFKKKITKKKEINNKNTSKNYL